MEYKGIIITGPSGVGKSTVARRLCEKYDCFQIVQAVTTRKMRKDDYPGQYEYISMEKFNSLDKEGKLLVKAEYRGQKYGILKSSFESVLNAGKVPVVIITPELMKEMKEKCFLSVFLDAPDNILNDRLKSRGEILDESILKQRAIDREYKKDCLYELKNIDVEKTVDLLQCLWEYRNSGGILPSRIIRLMIECGMLLEGNVKEMIENIQGASYDLSLGDEYYSGGRIKRLTDKNPFLIIEPYDYAIVTSKENANFPKDIAGRFDLSVSLFCQGVILSNGPQIDPGFKGKLFCLLFNTSNTPVVLKRGQHYATLEFHKLLEPTSPYEGQYQNRFEIIHYLPSNTLRGAISELRKDLEKVKKESLRLQTMALSIIGAFLTIIAILLAFR